MQKKPKKKGIFKRKTILPEFIAIKPQEPQFELKEPISFEEKIITELKNDKEKIFFAERAVVKKAKEELIKIEEELAKYLKIIKDQIMKSENILIDEIIYEEEEIDKFVLNAKKTIGKNVAKLVLAEKEVLKNIPDKKVISAAEKNLLNKINSNKQKLIHAEKQLEQIINSSKNKLSLAKKDFFSVIESDKNKMIFAEKQLIEEIKEKKNNLEKAEEEIIKKSYQKINQAEILMARALPKKPIEEKIKIAQKNVLVKLPKTPKRKNIESVEKLVQKKIQENKKKVDLIKKVLVKDFDFVKKRLVEADNEILEIEEDLSLKIDKSKKNIFNFGKRTADEMKKELSDYKNNFVKEVVLEKNRLILAEKNLIEKSKKSVSNSQKKVLFEIRKDISKLDQFEKDLNKKMPKLPSKVFIESKKREFSNKVRAIEEKLSKAESNIVQTLKFRLIDTPINTVEKDYEFAKTELIDAKNYLVNAVSSEKNRLVLAEQNLVNKSKKNLSYFEKSLLRSIHNDLDGLNQFESDLIRKLPKLPSKKEVENEQRAFSKKVSVIENKISKAKESLIVSIEENLIDNPINIVESRINGVEFGVNKVGVELTESKNHLMGAVSSEKNRLILAEKNLIENSKKNLSSAEKKILKVIRSDLNKLSKFESELVQKLPKLPSKQKLDSVKKSFTQKVINIENKLMNAEKKLITDIQKRSSVKEARIGKVSALDNIKHKTSPVLVFQFPKFKNFEVKQVESTKKAIIKWKNPLAEVFNRIMSIINRSKGVKVVDEPVLIPEKSTITTIFDSIYAELKKKKVVDVDYIANKYSITKQQVIDVAMVFEESGKVEIFYPLFGSPKLILKETGDLSDENN